MDSIKKSEKLGHDEVYDLLISKEVSWQAIIYDLINTEQLDPWDIDLSFLANKYLEKIKLLEDADFIVSSKVLLAASILLRLKSEILIHHYMRSIDEILFGKKEETLKGLEKIEINENELPDLYPKTPLPRNTKVSLEELMSALNRAISTETRRIKREVERVYHEKNTDIVLPKAKISIKDRIRKIYSQILTAFKRKKSRISYSELTNNDKKEKIACFLPCLHLDTQQKLFLEQESHFNEIWVWLYKHYKQQNEAVLETKMEIAEKKEEIDEKAGFDNPLANFSDVMSEIIKGEI